MPDFKIFKGKPSKVFKMFRHDNTALIFLIQFVIVVAICVVLFFHYYNKMVNSNTIQDGIFIKGIDVSGLTKEEAIEKVNNEISSKMNETIELVYNNSNYYVEIEQIEAYFDVESSVDIALSFAKSGTMSENIKEYLGIRFNNIDIDPVLKYNDEALTKYIETIQTYLPDQLEQPYYYIEDGTLYVTNGVNGAGIYIDELKEEIIQDIQDISYSNKYITIPTYTEYPDPIDVNQIHEEVYREKENAYYTTEPYAVFADVKGIDFDTEKLTNEINENPDEEEYSIDLDYSTADVTVNDLGMDAFPNLIASFSTEYYTSNTDRTTNLRLAASKINGTVVMPGETFSYNSVVGKRTIAAGYKEAAIYSNGEVTSGVGGGICQISTTLYNAVVRANMEVTVRRNHQFVPSYAKAGTDATVVWGSQDFKFENTRDYPIKIKATVEDGVATIKIYGLKQESDKYSISIQTDVVKSTSTSLVVDAYKVYKLDGEVVKSEKLHRDTYKVSSSH